MHTFGILSSPSDSRTHTHTLNCYLITCLEELVIKSMFQTGANTHSLIQFDAVVPRQEELLSSLMHTVAEEVALKTVHTNSSIQFDVMMPKQEELLGSHTHRVGRRCLSRKNFWVHTHTEQVVEAVPLKNCHLLTFLDGLAMRSMFWTTAHAQKRTV